MLVTISSTMSPATDLGFLLHKHPDRVHERELSFGVARVVYPEATWYANVQPGDVSEIVESHMVAGRPVERLVYHWPAP